MTTVDVDSIDDFQLKHGSLIGGARKGCICLSLRLAVFLQGLIKICILLSLMYAIFMVPLELFSSDQESTLFISIQKSNSYFNIDKIVILTVQFFKQYASKESIAFISNAVLLLRKSSTERDLLLLTIFLALLASIISTLGAIGRSQGLIKLSIILFLASQALSILGIFYAPTFGRLYNMEALMNPVILLFSLTLVIFYTMWYTHLLYSLFKVLRAGGNGGEYLSYREIIDRRNFLRWKTWKERELERGSPFNPSYSRSSEKDRLIKSTR
ncbi:putative membrane protein [Cryptosporidium felis]|nr:putative membrane protein [Cryptosporidium felis]